MPKATKIRRYCFRHKTRYVWITAGSINFAKEKFQARWGYWPNDPVEIESVDREDW